MNEEREQADHLGTPEAGHEQLTINVRAVAIGTAALVVLIALTIVAMGPLARLLTPREAADEADSFVELPVAAPQTTVGLNPNQAEDRLHLEARQHAWLAEYAWLDEGEQVARIPIERAMQMIQERGLDIASQAPAAPAATTEVENQPPDHEGGEQ